MHSVSYFQFSLYFIPYFVSLHECVLSHSAVSDSFNPVDCSPPGSSAPGISQARILEWAAISPQGIFPTQGWKLHLLCLLHPQVDSLPLEPPGKPLRKFIRCSILYITHSIFLYHGTHLYYHLRGIIQKENSGQLSHRSLQIHLVGDGFLQSCWVPDFFPLETLPSCRVLDKACFLNCFGLAVTYLPSTHIPSVRSSCTAPLRRKRPWGLQICLLSSALLAQLSAV